MKARSTTACWSVASRRRRWPGEAGEEGAVVVARVREMEGDHGFNAQTGIYENLVEAGVIDPTKVVRSARQNAASIASLLLSTEAVICESPGAKDAGPTSGGMPLAGDVLTPGGRGGATRSGDRAAAGAGER